MSDVGDVMQIAAAGLRAQAARMRVVAENLANSDSTAREPGGDPYRRKIPIFESVLDRETNLNLVRMTRAALDKSDFGESYDPGHPAADERGYIKTTKLKGLIETLDLSEAQRSYEANINVYEASREMLGATLDLLRR
ncbi:MAG: flagellar basal body rod protein FlgC [Maricaulaceae bacterium]